MVASMSLIPATEGEGGRGLENSDNEMDSPDIGLPTYVMYL